MYTGYLQWLTLYVNVMQHYDEMVTTRCTNI